MASPLSPRLPASSAGNSAFANSQIQARFHDNMRGQRPTAFSRWTRRSEAHEDSCLLFPSVSSRPSCLPALRIYRKRQAVAPFSHLRLSRPDSAIRRSPGGISPSHGMTFPRCALVSRPRAYRRLPFRRTSIEFEKRTRSVSTRGISITSCSTCCSRRGSPSCRRSSLP